MVVRDFVQQSIELISALNNFPKTDTKNPKQIQDFLKFISEQLCPAILQHSNIDKKYIYNLIYIHGNPSSLSKESYTPLETFQELKKYLGEQDSKFKKYFTKNLNKILGQQHQFSSELTDFWIGFFAKSSYPNPILSIWDETQQQDTRLALYPRCEGLSSPVLLKMEQITSKWVAVGKPVLFVAGIGALVSGILGILSILSIPFGGSLALIAASVLFTMWSAIINKPTLNTEDALKVSCSL
jgi:hypothetical protein